MNYPWPTLSLKVQRHFVKSHRPFLWRHPVHKQWDKISHFSVINVPFVRYWGADRQQQIAWNWCRQWNAMINNTLRNVSTPSAARFIKTSPATLNEIIWSITLIAANKGTWCNCVVSLLIDWHIMLLGYFQAKGWQNMGPDFAIITNQGTGRSTKPISFIQPHNINKHIMESWHVLWMRDAVSNAAYMCYTIVQTNTPGTLNIKVTRLPNKLGGWVTRLFRSSHLPPVEKCECSVRRCWLAMTDHYCMTS